MGKYWIALVDWNGSREEIEVQADNYESALIEVRKKLKKEYEEGGKIVSLKESVPEIVIHSIK